MGWTGDRIPRPDLDRLMGDIEALAQIRDDAEPGATRRVLTPEYATGRELVADLMASAGLDVEHHPSGNIIGRRAGRTPALATGSHTDTVRGGGRLDGILGVLGAIEAVRALDEAGVELDHELRVVDFLGEEPNDWGVSCIGSRALAGDLGPDEIACRAPDGSTLGETMARFGVDPQAATRARWSPDELLAFVELHIEQGPVLETEGVPIGVVTGIVGVERMLLEFHGRRDHAGTMPMTDRHDALTAAAEALLAVEEVVSDGKGVGTCGRIEIEPGAINVVPDRATVTAEIRSVDPAWLDEKRAEIEQRAGAAGDSRGVRLEITDLPAEGPTIMADHVMEAIETAVSELGLESTRIPSGAGHDTGEMKELGPVGMIFVPSIGGRSHTPEEDTAPDDLAAGVAALALTLAILDQRP